MERPRHITAWISVTMLAGALVLPGTGVAAATAQEVPTHCAVRLVPVGPGGFPGEVETEIVDLGCYETYAQAFSAGSGGQAELPASVTPAQVTQAMLDEAGVGAALGDYHIGTEWDNTAYGGSSIQYWATGDCVGTTWTVDWVGAAWNDRFESGKGFASCDRNKKFEDIDFGGAVRTCTPNCTGYGALNNEVSALKWLD